MNSFYTEEELKIFPFKKIGKNVLISKKASIYSAESITIGNNVRIDDYVLLSGNIEIGNYVHISAYSALYGGKKIIIDDYCGCSARCTLISATDDFSGNYMVGAVIDNEFTNVIKGTIKLKKYVQLGANTIVLPKVVIGEGVTTGAFTFVNKNLDDWYIYVGIPAHKLKVRSKKMLEKVSQFEQKYNN